VSKDVVEVVNLSKENKDIFLERLTYCLLDYFKCEYTDLPDNYGDKNPWSLINLIKNDDLDSYTMVFVNDFFWGGSGGILRDFNGEKIYQGGFRWFSNAENAARGLGSVKSYNHIHSIGHQLERAKINGCTKYIISFNDYRYRYMLISKNYHFKKVFPDIDFKPSSEMIMFNNVPQWLLTVDLD
jgi:hypothetical protein